MSSLRLRGFGVMLLLLWCQTACGRAQVQATSESVTVTVEETSPAVSTFAGMGVEFDPYEAPPTDARWATILDRLKYARPGFVRMMISTGMYCFGFDADGTPQFAWDHPEDVRANAFHRIIRSLEFAQAQGIDVYLGEWFPSTKSGLKGPADPRWPKVIAGLLQYLSREKHFTVVNHYILINEPNGNWTWNGKPDYAAWSKGIRNVRAELDARGFTNVLLAGPDTTGAGNDWFEETLHDSAKYFGTWERHIYATDVEIYEDKLEQQLDDLRLSIFRHDPQGVSKQRVLGEAGIVSGKDHTTDSQPRVMTFGYGLMMADFTAQMMRAGWMGAAFWDLDDHMHLRSGSQPARWGFWDSGQASDMEPRPWFYTWALMSRFFPKGAHILQVRSTPQVVHFRAAAAEWSSASGKQHSLLLVNDSSTPRKVSLAASLFAGGKVYAYHYFDGDRPVDEQLLPKAAKTAMVPANSTQQITVSMPGGGVILLTTAE